MFERYTESARRVLFFSRYQAAKLGSLTIRAEHVLLGVLRDAPTAVERFTRTEAAAETLRQSLDSIAGTPRERASTSVEIPFSNDTKLALSRSALEADQLGNHVIAPEHLVLGVLVASSEAAARALSDAGVEPDAIRTFLRNAPDEALDRHRTNVHTAHLSLIPHVIPAVAGVVLRQWRGVVRPGLADQYLRHLRGETLPLLKRLPGFIDATIMKREIDDGTEFQVTTVWRALQDIEAFAGADVTIAVVPPAAQALMVRFDDRAAHYEIVG
jgi:heme-degrading monooxygenase HmoA